MAVAIFPSVNVLKAFNVTTEPILLPGGQGAVYRAGNIILKPTDSKEESLWFASIFGEITQDGFRIPRYITSTSGELVVGGWFAQEYVEGEHSNTRWQEVIETCKSFHKALAKIPRPAFLDTRIDPWSVADRVAWQESPLVCFPELEKPLYDLFSVVRPVNLPNQLIHGDFTMNVLFADGLPPAVIDFSPYWRPTEFAIAVVVADALVWQGADASMFDHVKDVHEIDQMLVRAEIRRIMEIDGHHRQYGTDGLKDVERHLNIVDMICERALKTA
ncbi:MAG: TIGR02569 family protein [Candidatus Sungbacteria bacterium]|nr:TIGR02569 family protein [Candidatus Sungbacteria bacterium]